MRNRTPSLATVAAALVGAAVLAGATAANGAVILDAGGWRAEVDDTLANSVSLDVLSSDNRVLTVRKTATLDSVNPLSGQPDAVVITFTQTTDDATAATRIVIDDESITNQTGLPWTQFQMSLLDSGNATFNQTLSAGLSIEPFTNRSYTPDSTGVSFDGGTVADGATWTPGVTAGELVIDVDLSGPDPMVFSLKELPIPSPGAGALAAIGLIAGLRRRRN